MSGVRKEVPTGASLLRPARGPPFPQREDAQTGASVSPELCQAACGGRTAPFGATTQLHTSGNCTGANSVPQEPRSATVFGNGVFAGMSGQVTCLLHVGAQRKDRFPARTETHAGEG